MESSGRHSLFRTRSIQAAVLMGAWLAFAPAARADVSGDVVLSGYYLGKAAVPFFFLPVAIEDKDMVLLSTMGLFAVMTVPSTGVLAQRWLGNPEKVGLWRNIAFATDMACAGGGALYGLWVSMQPTPERSLISNRGIGTMIVLASGLYGLVSLLDRIPFSSEPLGSGRYSLDPVYSPVTQTAGLALRHRF